MKTIILFGLVLGALSAADKVYIAEVGGKVTLQCGITSFRYRLDWKRDYLVILRFEKNGVTIKGETPFKTRTKPLRDRDIEISEIKESDSGKFTCVGDRSSHEHHLIVVSVSAPSGPLKVGADATLDCKANSGGSGLCQPEVKWRKPDGSVQTESKVELKSVALTDKGTWQCLVSCQGETITKTVTINVEEPVPEPTTPTLVNNPKNPNSGNGKDSSGGPEDPMMLLGLVWWIWVAIGAGSLVVIILVIVIIVMHKRNKRKKSNVLERAVDWIFSHLDDLDSMEVSEAGRSAAESEGGRDPPPGPRVRDGPGTPVLDDSTVSQLCEMGFPLEACRKAVYYTGNSGIDAAMNWIMSHMDDPDFSAPLVLPGSSSGPGTTPTESLSEEHLATIVSMGFSRDQATKALRATMGHL